MAAACARRVSVCVECANMLCVSVLLDCDSLEREGGAKERLTHTTLLRRNEVTFPLEARPSVRGDFNYVEKSYSTL